MRRVLPSIPGVPCAETFDVDLREESSFGDPMHKLILVETGQLDVEGSAGGWLIVPNHLIFIPAERAFTIRSAPRTTFHVAHLEPSDAVWGHRGCWTTGATPLAREMLGQAVQWSPAQVQAGGTPRLFFQTLSGLCLDWFSNPRMLWMPAAKSDPMRDAIRYLRDHIDQARLDGVSAAAGLSTRTLQRRCESELGLSWRDLLREVRMMRSLELLASFGSPVSSVARAVGFASTGAFTTAFTDRFGLTPTAYLRRWGAASSKKADTLAFAVDPDETEQASSQRD
jgi:AraC-like DNA-binding protein